MAKTNNKFQKKENKSKETVVIMGSKIQKQLKVQKLFSRHIGLLNPSVFCVNHAAKRQAGTGSSIGKDGMYKVETYRTLERIYSIRAAEVISNGL